MNRSAAISKALRSSFPRTGKVKPPMAVEIYNHKTGEWDILGTLDQIPLFKSEYD